MVDASVKKQDKKGETSDEDVCILFQRYRVEQVLALLREVAHQSADVKIDWHALVKNTESEITNARECQMLWRHLAYREPLAEEIEEGSQPMDDDSDLEYEMEASPPVSIEFAREVANCIKVLGSGSPNESSMPNNSVAEGDMSHVHSSKASSENRHSSALIRSSNITHPVSVQKQPQAAGRSGEALDSNSVENNKFPPRRKRKQWSEEEDIELIAAVKKFGESNWANIVKGEFKGDRSASQLSQRWAIIRKKQGTLNGVGGASSQLSEAQLATRRAIDMALKDNLAGAGNGAATSNQPNIIGDIPTAGNTVSSQPQNPLITNKPCVKPGPMGIPKSRPPLKKAPTVPSVSDSIQAVAVAAGARIASPSDAATLFKAAQSKNAVHIIGSSPLIKSSTTGSGSLPPNVHFFRTGLAASTATSVAVGSTTHPPGGGHQAKGITLTPTVPSALDTQLSKASTTTSSTSASEPPQMEDKSSSEVKVPISEVKPVAVEEDNATSLSRCLPKLPGTDAVPGKPTVDADNAQCAMRKDVLQSEFKNAVDSEKRPTVERNCNPNTEGNDRVSPCSVDDGDGVKKMVSGEAGKSVQTDL